jgi:hypothetical protein
VKNWLHRKVVSPTACKSLANKTFLSGGGFMPQKQTLSTKHTGRLKWSALFLATLALHMVDARADEAEYPAFSFNGFGTLGMVHSSERNADFTATLFQPNGAGVTRRWSPDVDSRIGAQLTIGFSERLEGILQVVAEQRWDDSYSPHVEWANLRYSFTPDFSIRGGRIVLPAYMYSQSRKVGYSYPWVRPPVGLYARFPITNADGVDATYRVHIKGTTNKTTAYYGNNHDNLPPFDPVIFANGVRTESKDIWGLIHTIDYGPWSFHASYFSLKLSLLSVAEFLRSIGLEDEAKTNIDIPFNFKALGVTYDPGSWFFMAEAVRSRIGTERFGPWAVTAGYRINDFTPFLSYSVDNYGTRTNGFYSPRTVSAGIRWDFVRNVDLKLQYDQIKIDEGAHGLLIDTNSDYRGGKVHVTNIALDFVF